MYGGFYQVIDLREVILSKFTRKREDWSYDDFCLSLHRGPLNVRDTILKIMTQLVYELPVYLLVEGPFLPCDY